MAVEPLGDRDASIPITYVGPDQGGDAAALFTVRGKDRDLTATCGDPSHETKGATQ